MTEARTSRHTQGPMGWPASPAWNTAGCGLGELGIWAFHGDLDDVVARPAASSR
jgi:NAD(P)H-dependent flavin oxidoreductase YrpB (nitropropane dioxygenase family)